MKQLELSNSNTDNKKLPLPLETSRKYGFDLQYHEAENGLLYAVQDWIRGLTGQQDIRKIWSNMKNQTFISNRHLELLPYVASDGKTYQREYTSDETLYLIAQNLRVTASRPQLKTILEFLAKAGVFMDNATRNPGMFIAAGEYAYEKQGKSPSWVEKRTVSIVKRKHFTDAMKAAVNQTLRSKDYATATNAEYIGLFNRTSAELETLQGKKGNVRDNMHWVALHYIALAEGLLADEMAVLQDIPFPMAVDMIRRVCAFVGEQVKQTERIIGIDTSINKPLLKDEN